jgi:EAL domain-containing protein (putative c-di-GMP-specific phosphodiesterase class I)
MSGSGDIRSTMEIFTDVIGPARTDVVFQPIVDLTRHTLFAVEALARCRVPGLESPSVLFEDAVAKGYCGRLGRMIRELTVKRVGDVPVFTNVHPDELTQRWLIRPDDPIYSHQNDVYIEITESVPFSHFDLCVSMLREIQSRGNVHLVIDDLGAGYSNLQRIVDLAPTIVKLDMQLVRGIDRLPRKQKLIKSIVSMCGDQGARVVAEGIETVPELKAVIDAGVQLGQGYLLAKPAYPIPSITWPEAVTTKPAR